MLLIDKSYFDYDYEKNQKRITMDNTMKSESEISRLMRKFGIGQRSSSAEDLQSLARKELNVEN